ncbi:MAG: endonuclease MutS2 [Chloroflexi bacterium]|nr:endonuclease MutS2 [Chloroflexota bacterium]
MHAKHLSTLEFPKVLARLATYASFSAGEEEARSLTPATDLREIRWRMETTSEARSLLDVKPDTTLGGAHDIRPLVQVAQRGAVLPTTDLLDVRDTLVAARSIHRTLSRLKEQFPRMADIAGRIQLCPQIITEINRCLDERGIVRDDASPELARIRREERIAHDRIQDKLRRIISTSRNAPFLQEPIITQREDRYVIPLKADFKGRIKGVVHDVSASGATVFVEPLSVVELNNAWRELQLKEQQEVHRILAHLSDLTAEHAAEIKQTVGALAELDLAFAKAKYADAIDATAPELVPNKQTNKQTHGNPAIRLINARHPLLDPKTVVPISVVLDDETHVLIITGPNTGGKTVSLKTMGLLTLMAQAGLHIPVQAGSAISAFKAVYADIGDEQSIEQSLSTFSSHLTNMLSFLDLVDEHSMVLPDELGAGTDPAEGAALARSLLDHFRSRGVTAFVATHYPELKTYAQLVPGVRNACVEFDSETLSPTYKLSIGLPGRSNAFAIAQRLGMPHKIVQAARQLISPDDMRTEDMLTDIHKLRIQEAQARDQANKARSEVTKLTRELRGRLESIEQERQQVLEQAHEQAAEELETVQAEARALRRRLQAAGVSLKAVSEIEESVDSLAEELEDELGPAAPMPEILEPPALPRSLQRPIRPGDAVHVQPLNSKGQVLEIKDQEAEVQVGQARVRVSLAALELCALPPVKPEAEEPAIHISAAPSPGTRLDLRGRTVDEALQQLDHHLDASMRAELPWIRIIHGKGTGALRRAVREFLVDHPIVSSYESGGDKEGGSGVTIVKLVA